MAFAKLKAHLGRIGRLKTQPSRPALRHLDLAELYSRSANQNFLSTATHFFTTS